MEYTPLSRIIFIFLTMLIGELSEKTGFSRDTIRFYEKQGLISVNRKERRANNYKEYSEDTLRRLLTIKVVKGFGFTLNETGELLDLIQRNQATCDNVSEKVTQKVSLIDQKIAELQQLREVLISTVDSCSTCCDAEGENCELLVITP